MSSRKSHRRLRVEQLEPRHLLSISLASGNWTPIGSAPVRDMQVGGMHGDPFNVEDVSGRIAGVAGHPTDPNTIYIAAAGGGVSKTTDGGSTWTPLTDSQETLFMGAIAVSRSNPDVIYAGTGESSNSGLSYYGRGVLKSIDGGATWTLLGNTYFNRRTISAIVIHPTNPDTVYVALASGGTNGLSGNTGIWRSTDGGATWTNTTTSISTSAKYTDLVMDPSDPQTLYAAVGTNWGAAVNGVYKTVNGGNSWAAAGDFPTGTTLGRVRLTIAPSDPQRLYASIAGSGQTGSAAAGWLFKMMTTTDGGATWTQLAGVTEYLMGGGSYCSTLAVDPADPLVVYAGGRGGAEGFIGSRDGGQSWFNMAPGGTNGVAVHPDHQSIGFDASGRLLDGNDGGIWRLDDPNPATLAWANLNGNLQITQFVGIALDPTNPDIVYGGNQDNGTAKFTGTVDWQSIRYKDGGFVRVDQTTPSTVYHEYQYGELERSDNAGATWAQKRSGINTSDPRDFYTPYVIDPSNSSRLLYGTERVYETTNRADNWTAISAPSTNGWTSTAAIDSLAAAPTDTNTIYAAADGRLFVTTDHGASWNERNPVPSPSASLEWNDMLVDPTSAQVAYVVAANFNDITTGGHVWRTTNAGATWNNISGNLPDLPTYSIALDPRAAGSGDDVLWVGTDTGVYLSTDLGGTWTRFGTGLPNVQARDLDLSLSLKILAAGTHGRSVWEISLDSAAPSGVDLLAASDTGVWDTDDLTNRDNSGPSSTLQFRVDGTLPGATVTVYADGTAIGSAVASGASTTVLTGGSYDLADGPHVISARQAEAGKYTSADSPTLTTSIDTMAPSVGVLSPADDAAGVTLNTNLVITFGENVQKGTGNVVIRKSSDTSIVETIAVASGQVRIAGAVATIDPATILAGSTGYYIEVDAGAFQDLAGNDFAGIGGLAAWNLTTRQATDYYVNDNSTTNDEWSTAIGDDANDGLSPSTPKATVQAILATYDLEPGDTVRIDTGTYNLASNIQVTADDGGSSAANVTFEASPYGVTIDRGDTGTFNLVGTHPDAVNQPTSWGKTLGTLKPFNGKIYAGFGDWNTNTGPIGVRAFDPGTNAFSSRLLNSQTEALEIFREIGGKLYAPWIDPKGSYGGYALGVAGGSAETWTDVTTSSFTHVFDILTYTGSDLWMVGGLGVNGIAARSVDGGGTWAVSLSVSPLPGYAGDRIYGACAYDGKLYVQANHMNMSPSIYVNQTKVFDGTSWSDGPDLTPLSPPGGFMSHPEVFAGYMVYQDKLTGAGNASGMYKFDGTSATLLPGDTFYDYTISDGVLYTLSSSGLVQYTRDLVNWTTIDTAPADARSLAVQGRELFVGATNAELYRYSGNDAWDVTGQYVKLTTATSTKYPGVGQSWMRVTGAYYGVNLAGAYDWVSRLNVDANYDTGIIVNGSTADYVKIENSVVRGTINTTGGGFGIWVNDGDYATIQNCTAYGNGGPEIYLSYSDSDTLLNNIAWSSGAGDSAVSIYATSLATSDYNDFYATGGAGVGAVDATARPTLPQWQAATGQDVHSISADPLFANPAGGDFHLKSRGGRYDPALGWVLDTVYSPCIDAGNPTSAYANESAPNGGRINIGAYGNTEQASRSFIASLDADGNGTADALSDGILILRYLFDPTGAWNVNDALGSGATRTARDDIKSYLDGGVTTALDPDGNGTADALSDGILILRYLFDPGGAWNVNDALGAGAMRTTRPEIRDYLDQYNPGIGGPPGLAALAAIADNLLAQSPEHQLSQPQIFSPIPGRIAALAGDDALKARVAAAILISATGADTLPADLPIAGSLGGGRKDVPMTITPRDKCQPLDLRAFDLVFEGRNWRMDSAAGAPRMPVRPWNQTGALENDDEAWFLADDRAATVIANCSPYPPPLNLRGSVNE